jgi:aryl-alcohol dehydrogenase-like predicted oxidoreductase
LSVPPLGIGVWSWGDTRTWTYGRSHTRDDVEAAYRACLDAGLTFFDTAEIYGSGESERLLGQCRRADGRPITIATKFAPLPTRLSPSALWDALEASLERLGAQVIDLYQVHWPYTLLDRDALMDMLALAVRSGKVRAVGVSNYGAGAMRKAHARLARHGIPLASNQVHYSLLHRQPERNGVLEACRDLDVALIAYSPLEQGLLTGKYRLAGGQAPRVTGSRRWNRLFSARGRQALEPLMEVLATIAQARQKTLGQVALNWLLATDEHVIPIPGAKTAQQAREHAGALGWRLSDDDYARIAAAARPVSWIGLLRQPSAQREPAGHP